MRGVESIPRRRVVISGAGIVSSVGSGRDVFWDGLEQGRSGARRVALDGVGEITACVVGDLDDASIPKREAKRMDRAGLLAVVAASQAIDDAGSPSIDQSRIGAVVANVHGGADTLHRAYADFFQRGADRVSPFTVPLGLTNSPVAAVARVLGLRGPSSTVATACAAGTDAIGLAVSLIRSGAADAMLAGGAEAPVSPFIVAAYRQLGALSTSGRPPSEASRPFDRARDGFVIGEGAGILFLEEREHALGRGARILAEVVGHASNCDAGHLTQPDETGEGPASAIKLALADGLVSPEDVGYLNAHATSTPLGDLAEARAITAAGLGHAPVSSTKALHGHTLGAAGGIEAVAALMPLVRDQLPQSWNLVDPDADCALEYVTAPRAAAVDATVSNSFGFGGHNAVLVMVRSERRA
jgi:3-oxoacyl-[acyl-carrier-protein] synthase II